MNLMRKNLFIVIFLCLPILLSAQQTPKTLLWRISGKGLTKPSYLFGTMHLNDQRLFSFGDSVYRAIERTEGLAIEISPDEICAEMMTQFFEENEKGKKVKDILGEKDFKANKEALEKKFGKSADKITSRDLMNEKNKWVNEMMEKGEMSTFMDAWLYNVARRQGKWLGGIEDMSDQTGLEEELIDKSDVAYLLAGDSLQDKENNAMLEEMVKIYLAQDLDGVEKMYGNKSAKEKDLVLIRRNVKMARRMDSLANIRSMFLAVGLAHLPGDSGVIRLLQKRGFKVEPVFSKKSLAAKEYTFKEVQIPWVHVKDEQGLYDVQMPANPASTKYLGVVDLKFLFDLFNMSGFCTMAIINPNMGNRDSLVNEVAAGFMQGDKKSVVKDLKREGMIAREYIQKDNQTHTRIRLFATDNVLYLVLVAGIKESSITGPDAEKFFNSFVINKVTPPAQGSVTFTDSVMGITMQGNVKLGVNKEFSPEDSKEFKITGFSGNETATGTYVLLFSREVRPGYYITSDSTIFDEAEKQMNNQYRDVKKVASTVQGYPAITLTGRNKEYDDVYAKAFSVVRDNRSLVLMVIGDGEHMKNGSTDVYFNSFRFIGQPKRQWNMHPAPDNSYAAWTPTPLKLHVDDGENFQIAYDTLTSSTFFVAVDTFDKYSWYEDDSSFWQSMIGADPDNRLLYNKPVKNGDFAGREIMRHLSETGKAYSRVRMIPHGNLLYRIFCASTESYLKGENSEKFFESFRINGPKTAPVYLLSKATLLLQDLLSKDSATRVQAYEALSVAPFSKTELPLLKEAFLKDYLPVDSDQEDASIAYRLASKIAGFKDEATVDFIKQHYASLKKDQSKNAALTTLAMTLTDKSYNTLADLLLSSVPAREPYYWFKTSLQDSMALTAKIFPRLQKLAADTCFAPVIITLARNGLDSNYITKELVAAAAADYLKVARSLEQKMKSDPDYFKSWVYDLLSVIGKLNTPEGNKMLTDFTTAHFRYIKRHAVLTLLENKQPVPASAIDSLAADKETRTVIYEDLAELKKTNLFPKKYYTQTLFAESHMYRVANRDDITPSAMEYVQKKKATVKGKSYDFYFYKITYAGEDGASSSYLGIVGGYDVTGKKAEPVKYMADISMAEEFDANRIGELFADFLKYYEEQEE